MCPVEGFFGAKVLGLWVDRKCDRLLARVLYYCKIKSKGKAK